MLDTYKTINNNASGFYADKGSKFYSFIYNIENKEDVKEKILALKKEYHDAQHHVYAFVLGEDKKNYNCSDDGEPSNSSGIHVLGQIRSFDLTNVLIVVVRYFGGTKLGISGLINAYKTAAFEAINNTKIIEKTINTNIELYFSYDEINFVMKIIKDLKAEITNQNFVEQCYVKVSIRKSLENTFIEKIQQNHKIKIIENQCKNLLT